MEGDSFVPFEGIIAVLAYRGFILHSWYILRL